MAGFVLISCKHKFQYLNLGKVKFWYFTVAFFLGHPVALRIYLQKTFFWKKKWKLSRSLVFDWSYVSLCFWRVIWAFMVSPDFMLPNTFFTRFLYPYSTFSHSTVFRLTISKSNSHPLSKSFLEESYFFSFSFKYNLYVEKRIC